MKMRWPYTTEFYSAAKKNEIMETLGPMRSLKMVPVTKSDNTSSISGTHMV